MITQERLKELFDYNPETGELINKINRGTRARKGQRAGCVDVSQGYRVVRIDGKNRREHIMIWVWMTGSYPTYEIDHINRVRDDNRWCNLRDVSHHENTRNQGCPKNNLLGIKGVRKTPNNTYRASVTVNGKTKHIGTFKTVSEARQAIKDF